MDENNIFGWPTSVNRTKDIYDLKVEELGGVVGVNEVETFLRDTTRTLPTLLGGPANRRVSLRIG